MRISVAAILAAACASLTSAYTTPVGASTSGNPLSKPAMNEIVPAGQSYTITWNPTTTGTVTLVLLRGPSANILPLYPIVEGAANSGTYSWTPSTSLEPDTTHYGIQLIDDASGAYQYTPQFGVSNPGFSSSASASTTPRTVSQIADGQPQAPATTTSYTITGTATVTKVVSVVTSGAATSGVTGAATGDTSTTAMAPVSETATISTILLPTGNMTVAATLMTIATGVAGVSASAAASATPSAGGAEKLTAAGAMVMGLGAVFWAVL